MKKEKTNDVTYNLEEYVQNSRKLPFSETNLKHHNLLKSLLQVSCILNFQKLLGFFFVSRSVFKSEKFIFFYKKIIKRQTIFIHEIKTWKIKLIKTNTISWPLKPSINTLPPLTRDTYINLLYANIIKLHDPTINTSNSCVPRHTRAKKGNDFNDLFLSLWILFHCFFFLSHLSAHIEKLWKLSQPFTRAVHRYHFANKRTFAKAAIWKNKTNYRNSSRGIYRRSQMS